MTWKLWSCFFFVFLLLCGVVTQELTLEPMNAEVLLGSDVSFKANVQATWEVMTWQVRGGNLVLTVLASGEILPSSERFSARFCSPGAISCVEFTVHNVTRRETGLVICTIQGGDLTKTAQLIVQERGGVSILGGNITVKQDQQVEFQCVANTWFPSPTITWSQNGQAMDSHLYNTSSMSDGFYFNSTSILKFQAVSSSTVQCSASVAALQTPQSSSVFMVVVPIDWTVLIAVVCSFGGLALLVLLILGILFCYKRRKEKEPNYENEMKRVRTQSQLSAAKTGGQKQGQENPSYVPEGQASVTPSELTDSGFASNTFRMPDIVNSNRSGNGSNPATESGFRKHRHVTIV